MHITFRSSVIRSGMGGSGHSKPIIIGWRTAVVRPPSSRQECSSMCAKFRSSTNPPSTKKKHHVRNARHTWLKVETISPFLSSPLTNILSADTLALLSPEERLFPSCVETTVFTFSIKCIFRTVVENIWMAGPPGVRSFFTRCPFPS